MNRVTKILLALVLVLIVGVSYWVGRVQGGKVGPGRSAATNLVQDITIETLNKTDSGAIYGDFTVLVKLKNTTKEPIRGLKVICQQNSSLTQYPTQMPSIETKLLYLADIPRGKERTLRFEGFKVQHPEQKQEITVNVIGYGGLGKLPYKAVFPPESND